MSHQLKQIYEFGPYRLDAAERLLLRDGAVVPLQPKVFDLLLALVERAGRLVEKDELMKLVWPDTIVEEANLASNISILRKTLNGNGRQFIETVPKRRRRRLWRWMNHLQKLTPR
jgi:DNA-binding winged helix-turn-helix (wHTH) protein